MTVLGHGPGGGKYLGLGDAAVLDTAKATWCVSEARASRLSTIQFGPEVPGRFSICIRLEARVAHLLSVRYCPLFCRKTSSCSHRQDGLLDRQVPRDVGGHGSSGGRAGQRRGRFAPICSRSRWLPRPIYNENGRGTSRAHHSVLTSLSQTRFRHGWDVPDLLLANGARFAAARCATARLLCGGGMSSAWASGSQRSLQLGLSSRTEDRLGPPP